MQNNIISDQKRSNPYYIMAKQYNGSSAGILVLHLLCHHLNMKGYPAFLATFGEINYKTKPGLVTPILDEAIIDFHHKNNQNPIVIYPDIVKGNPLNANCVVRYLLNYPGLLGGDSEFSKDDVIFTYTKKIAQKMGAQDSQILFIPISNTDIFYPPEDDIKRSGSCFYASKYQSFHNGKLFDITKDSVEITRQLPDSQTTEEVAELLRKSEVFYTYEDTSLIAEAILCGCPAVMVKNQFFNADPLASCELGSEGWAADESLENIEYAKKTIPIARQKFIAAVDNFWLQLDSFIQVTQQVSLKSKSNNGLKLILAKKKRIPIGRTIKQELVEVVGKIFRK